MPVVHCTTSATLGMFQPRRSRCARIVLRLNLLSLSGFAYGCIWVIGFAWGSRKHGFPFLIAHLIRDQLLELNDRLGVDVRRHGLRITTGVGSQSRNVYTVFHAGQDGRLLLLLEQVILSLKPKVQAWLILVIALYETAVGK